MTQPQLSNELLTELFNKLNKPLKQGDVDAESILNIIQKGLYKKEPEQLTDLLLAIEDYDFEQAIQLLKELSKQLSIALE